MSDLKTAGRPPRSSEPSTSRVTVRFTASELRRLDKVRRGVTRAAFVRALVAEAVS